MTSDLFLFDCDFFYVTDVYNNNKQNKNNKKTKAKQNKKTCILLQSTFFSKSCMFTENQTGVL